MSAFPVPGTKIIHAQNYGMSLWGKTAKIIVKLPSGEEKNYFLKVRSPRNDGICNGQFQSFRSLRWEPRESICARANLNL